MEGPGGIEELLEAWLVPMIERAVSKALASRATEWQDRLLDANEAGKVLCVAPTWLYKNHVKLPFTVKLHHRMLRFSMLGIQRYIAAKKGVDKPA